MMKLPDHWYVVAEPRELSTRRPNSLRRHGREWVVWRKSDGTWLMQQDRCPHRSASLSQGKIQSDCVVCPFHGFRFDSTGRCSHVPEMAREAPGLKLETHILHEAHGFLWWKRGEVTTAVPPWFEELPGGSWGTHYVAQWNQHLSRCIENQLDYAHLPFVHSNTIGAQMDVRKTVEFEATPESIRMIMSRQEQGGDRSEATGIRFLYPGLWRLKISPKMQAFIAFVAVDDRTTRYYLRTYQSMVTVVGLRRVVGWVMTLSNRIILRQDYAVVLGQTPGDVRQLTDETRETLFPSDQAIKYFRKWLG
jgi:phenylpropionate dioxygenase-like ring-hydroxylating dioxygenase large terminal subunit